MLRDCSQEVNRAERKLRIYLSPDHHLRFDLFSLLPKMLGGVI
jgi:hypothetical protein